MQAAFKLVSFFKNLRVDYVFDVTLSRDLALLERYLQVSFSQQKVCFNNFIVQKNSSVDSVVMTQDLCQCLHLRVQVSCMPEVLPPS